MPNIISMDTTINGTLDVAGGRIKDATGYIAPVGSIIMFGGAAAPVGWLLCNNASLLRAGTYAALFAVISTIYGTVDGTHFNVPDMRGIFPRGAGTSGELLDANGDAFAGTLGTYQNDKFQGHAHEIKGAATDTGAGSGWIDDIKLGGANSNPLEIAKWTGYLAMTGMGTPRTGAETNPSNLGVTFIIKY